MSALSNLIVACREYADAEGLDFAVAPEDGISVVGHQVVPVVIHAEDHPGGKLAESVLSAAIRFGVDCAIDEYLIATQKEKEPTT